MPTVRSFASVTKNSIPINQPKSKDINNNSNSSQTPNLTISNKGSQKRPLERRDSSPPDQTESQDSTTTVTRKPLKQPRHDDKSHLITSDRGDIEEMQVSEPPDQIPAKKRNSAPDLRKTLHKAKNKENELLNSMRKTRKEKDKTDKEK